jgi:hypothetical protein
MAGEWRTLKLELLAESKQFVDDLKKSENQVNTFGDSVQKAGDVAGKALLAFGALATGAAVAGLSFAKAAAEDEAAANKLEGTIKAVTNATDGQVKAVENYIKQTSLATGITDETLRPAFERLVRSTKDVDDATKLLNLSLDLAAATGKPLETVTSALARAYDGNTTALGKLGLGIDSALLKSKDFNAIYTSLNSTFGEFSETRSAEAIVKFERLKVAMDEAKESLGAALLPLFEKLSEWLLNEGVPRLNAFIAGLTGDKSLSAGFTNAQKSAEKFGSFIAGVAAKIEQYKEVVIAAAAVTATIWAVAKIQTAVVATIGFINLLIKAYNALKVSAVAAAVASRFAANPLAGAAAGAAVIAGVAAAVTAVSKNDNQRAATGLSYNEQRAQQIAASSVSAVSPVISVPSVAGSTFSSAPAPTQIPTITTTSTAAFAMGANARGEYATPFAMGAVGRGEYANQPAVVVNVNAPSVIDREGFSRAVVEALNESAYRGTGGGLSPRNIEQVAI